MEFKVPYIGLGAQFRSFEHEFVQEFRRVMQEGSFILRADVEKFEKSMAEYLGVRHVIGVNSGTDALYLSTRAIGLGAGDEVVTVAHTFVASTASIIHVGAKPVFVDIGEDFNMDVKKIEPVITGKTKAIMPVHLNGRVCQMDRLEEIALKFNLAIIEDSAQALGAMFKGRKAGSFGIANCFSLHPLKTLSCGGDGGFVSTNNDQVADKLRLMRDHGQRTKTDLEFFGYSSRLDNLHAAMLNIKFRALDQWIEKRRKIASKYHDEFASLPIVLPPKPSNGDHFDTFNSYVIRTSSQQRLHSFLREEKGIEAQVHISKPLTLHRKLNLPEVALPVNEKACREIVSLPIYPEMAEEQVEYVVRSVKEFFEG